MCKRFLIIVFCVIAVPLAAQDNELGASVGLASGVPGFDDLDAIGVHYNRYFGSLSAKVAVTRFSGDLDVTAAPDEGELDMTVFSGGVEFHFLRGQLFSPYIGGGVGYAMASLDGTLVDTEDDNQFVFLANGGVNVNITPRFAVFGDVSYMPIETDFPPVARIDMDPLTVSLGAKLRW